MPKSQSRKRSRDALLHAQWDARPSEHFERLGISHERIKAAQLGLQGHIVTPGDPTYDQDRMLANPVFDASPSLMVFCQAIPDVAIALQIASMSGKPFTIRSGGHCTAGFSAGYGVLIDCKGLNSITVDAANMKATVGAGCTFSALNATLESYGLHVPGGECEDVCVGGFVQGGGLGFTSVTFGMSCDNVLEMQVMLSDGSIVIANATTNYDLWWAMRGGTGGNFGVLLSVTYSLVALTQVSGWALAWPLSTSADVATATQVLMLLQLNYMQGSSYAPNLNIQVLLVYQTIIDPSQPPLPQPVPVFMVRGLWVGDPTQGAAAMQPLQQIGNCITQWSGTDTYRNVLDKLLNYPQEQPVTVRTPFEDKASRYVARDLTSDEWTSILNYYLGTPNNLSYVYLEFYGGAINAYPAEQSAFIHRTSVFNAVLDVYWYFADDRLAAENFLNGWIKLIDTMGNGEVYQNYCSINIADYAASYWGWALIGLYAVKQKYDPGHAFTFAQEVRSPGLGPVGPVINAPPQLVAAIGQPINYSGGMKAAAKPASR
jgi:hypothetical protein